MVNKPGSAEGSVLNRVFHQIKEHAFFAGAEQLYKRTYRYAFKLCILVYTIVQLLQYYSKMLQSFDKSAIISSRISHSV